MAERIPQGMFVVHLRSDSDLDRRHLVGRVEHVMSGAEEPFGSLEDLLGFMRTHAAADGTGPTEARQHTKQG